MLGFLSILTFACTEEPKEEVAKSEKEVKPLNPNGDSELALLMRIMADEVTAIQKAIKKGEKLGELSDYSTINTATATKENMKSDAYQSYAAAYLVRVDEFKAADEANKAQTFNTLVDACMNCHEVSCPGPMVRIEKMYVKK